MLIVIFMLVAGFGIVFGVTKLTSPGDTAANKDDRVIHEVALKKENKDPIDILIKKGEYVQFNSKDGGQHQVVQGNNNNTTHSNGSLDSGVFNGDEGYLLQFNEQGKFEFHDNYDHDYTMTIIVYDPDKESKLE